MNVVSKEEAKEGLVYLAQAHITGTALPSDKLVSKWKGKWRFEDAWRPNGRREFPKDWIGVLWELPKP